MVSLATTSPLLFAGNEKKKPSKAGGVHDPKAGPNLVRVKCTERLGLEFTKDIQWDNTGIIMDNYWTIFGELCDVKIENWMVYGIRFTTKDISDTPNAMGQ